jgi:hypothetical protein
MEVAFCHAKRGEREDQDADRLLEKVVEAAKSHRQRWLSQVEASESVVIMDEVAALFEEISKAPLSGQEAEERTEAIFGAHGLGLTEAGLDELDVDADEIIERKGPRNAAAEIVGKVMETSPRQMFYRQKQNLPALTPMAYGTRPGRHGLLRFGLQLIGVPSANIESIVQAEIQAESKRATAAKDGQEGVPTKAKPKDG